jgi:uncharacterized membrane protein required for colicin V production
MEPEDGQRSRKGHTDAPKNAARPLLRKGEHMSILTDHWLDIVAAIVLFISIWHGWRSGLLVGLFNLLSIPLGIVAAYFLAPRVAAATNISLTYMYAIIFFVTVIAVHIVGNVLRKGMRKRVKIAADTDALLGAIVGGAKAWILLVLFLVIWGNALNSSAVRTIACGLAPVNNSVASNLGNWETEYNQTVSKSLFAYVNGFIVPQSVNASGCGG